MLCRIGLGSFFATSSVLFCPFTHELTPKFSTVLKSDQWIQQSRDEVHAIRGVLNFRNIQGTNIYASGQPSLDAIDSMISRVRSENPGAQSIVWIMLREEPIVYVNGAPYCLVSHDSCFAAADRNAS
jgi:hypothetical protein